MLQTDGDVAATDALLATARRLESQARAARRAALDIRLTLRDLPDLRRAIGRWTDEVFDGPLARVGRRALDQATREVRRQRRRLALDADVLTADARALERRAAEVRRRAAVLRGG